MGSVTVDQKHVATEPKRGKTGKTKTDKCTVNERENSFQHRAVCSSCAPLPIYIGSQYEKFYIPLHMLKSSEHFSQDSIQCCEKPTGTHDFFPQFLLLYNFVINQHHHHILVEQCGPLFFTNLLQFTDLQVFICALVSLDPTTIFQSGWLWHTERLTWCLQTTQVLWLWNEPN